MKLYKIQSLCLDALSHFYRSILIVVANVVCIGLNLLPLLPAGTSYTFVYRDYLCALNDCPCPYRQTQTLHIFKTIIITVWQWRRRKSTRKKHQQTVKLPLLPFWQENKKKKTTKNSVLRFSIPTESNAVLPYSGVCIQYIYEEYVIQKIQQQKYWEREREKEIQTLHFVTYTTQYTRHTYMNSIVTQTISGVFLCTFIYF